MIAFMVSPIAVPCPWVGGQSCNGTVPFQVQYAEYPCPVEMELAIPNGNGMIQRGAELLFRQTAISPSAFSKCFACLHRDICVAESVVGHQPHTQTLGEVTALSQAGWTEGPYWFRSFLWTEGSLLQCRPHREGEIFGRG